MSKREHLGTFDPAQVEIIREALQSEHIDCDVITDRFSKLHAPSFGSEPLREAWKFIEVAAEDLARARAVLERVSAEATEAAAKESERRADPQEGAPYRGSGLEGFAAVGSTKTDGSRMPGSSLSPNQLLMACALTVVVGVAAHYLRQALKIPTGSSCKESSDCRGGACIGLPDEPESHVCSEDCARNADCPSSMTCGAVRMKDELKRMCEPRTPRSK